MPPPIQAKAPARRKPQKHLAAKSPRKYEKPSLAKHALRALLIWLVLVTASNAWAQSGAARAGTEWGLSVLNAPAAQLPLTSSSVCGVVTPTGATNRAPCVDISGGNITSVGLALPDIFSVTGSPLTGPGTITATLVPQAATAVLAGPVPSFRSLTSGDLPSTVAYTNVNNAFNGTQTLTNLTVTGTCSGCTGSGAVNSVTGTSGQIAASPTSGAVVLSLPATITSNETFSGALTFSGSIAGSGLTNYLASPAAIGGTVPAAGNFTTLGATGNLTTNITGSTQCIHANSAGVLSGTGIDCGSGGGGLPSLTNGQVVGNATGSTTTATATNLVAGSGVTITASGGNITIGASGSGGVSGPGSSVNTDLASWNGTGGNALADSGILLANVVQTSRTISTTAPLTGGSNLSANLTLGITIPTSGLLGGASGNFTSVTPGTCLSLTSGTLNGTCTGSVTSVGLALPASVFTISGSPVTSTGTLTGSFNNQAANSVFAGPGSGPSAAPGFRALIAADLPSSGVTPGSYTTANVTVNAQGQVTAASNGSASTPVIFKGTTAGTANAQTIASPVPSGFTFTDGFTVSAMIGAGLTNTGATTLAVNGTTAEPVEVQSSGGFGTLVGGEMVAGTQVQFVAQSACTCYVMTTIVGSPIVNNATSTTVTQAQWSHGTQFNVTTAGQTFTLPSAATLGAGGGIVVNAVGVSATIAPQTADGINNTGPGSPVTVCANNQASVFGVGSTGIGAFTANPLCAGGTTTVTLGGGLTSSPTTYNAGTQTITNGSTLAPQLFYIAEPSSCTINSTCKSGSTDDSGLLPTPTSTGVTISLPSPGSVGTKTYNIGYDGTHNYSIDTATGNIYGCGSGTGAGITGVSSRVQVVSDGTNWQCNQWGTLVALNGQSIPVAVTSSSLANSALSDNGTVINSTEPIEQSGKKVPSSSVYSIGWVAGQSPNNAIIVADLPAGITIASIVGRLEVAEGSSGTVNVYSVPSGTSCASGGTNLTNTTGFNTNGTAATNQALAGTTTTVASGSSLCLRTTGTFTTNIATISVYANPT